MQPIETHYNGYRFRSRLEARWAVFFNALGLAYRYEPEGFRLADGSAYLPDFFVPAWRSWVEIKPVKPTPETLERLRFFAPEGAWLLLLYGDIYEAQYGVWIWDGEMGCELMHDSAVIHRCQQCHTGWFLGENRYGASMLGLEPCSGGCHTWTAPTPAIEAAYLAARSARFEHGETPRGPFSPLQTRLPTRLPTHLPTRIAPLPTPPPVVQPLPPIATEDDDSDEEGLCEVCCGRETNAETGLCLVCSGCEACGGGLVALRKDDDAPICENCSRCFRCGSFIEYEDIVTDRPGWCGWCSHMFDKMLAE